MRRAAKTDDNQAAIVKALRAAGATVQSLGQVGDGCPDLLIGRRGKTLMLEVKDGAKPPSARALTDAQVLWHRYWRGGPVEIVKSIDDALLALETWC